MLLSARSALIALSAVSALAMLYVGAYQIRAIEHMSCPLLKHGCEAVADAPFARPFGIPDGFIAAVIYGSLILFGPSRTSGDLDPLFASDPRGPGGAGECVGSLRYGAPRRFLFLLPAHHGALAGVVVDGASGIERIGWAVPVENTGFESFKKLRGRHEAVLRSLNQAAERHVITFSGVAACW